MTESNSDQNETSSEQNETQPSQNETSSEPNENRPPSQLASLLAPETEMERQSLPKETLAPNPRTLEPVEATEVERASKLFQSLRNRKPNRPRNPKNESIDTVSDTGTAKAKKPRVVTRKGAPTATEWQRWLEYALTLLTTFYTDGLLRPIEDLSREDKQAVEAMNDTFVDDLSEPLSRILARNQLNQQYGRPVINSYDWLGVIIAVWGYHRDLAEIRARRKAAVAKKRLRAQTAALARQATPNFGGEQSEQSFPEATAENGQQFPGSFPVAVPPGAL